LHAIPALWLRAGASVHAIVAARLERLREFERAKASRVV